MNLIAALVMAAASAFADSPGLTIYNGGFATVRESITLDLSAGVSRVTRTDITRHLEPDSVILRDPAGKEELPILEQSFVGDPLSQDLLLQRFEGRTLSFLKPDGKEVKGKIVRAPYSQHQSAMSLYGNSYYQSQIIQVQNSQPIVEVDGKLQFSLPGLPLFPPLDEGETLKPTLSWLLESRQAGKVKAELSYITGGMTWKADYNIVGAEKGDKVAVVGWVTMNNSSGKSFEKARINLMAGDVNKVSQYGVAGAARAMSLEMASFDKKFLPREKALDEFHLYTLPRPTTLADRETKQVEFLRASDVKARTVYVYDGVQIDQNYMGWGFENIRGNRDYGTKSNPKVWVMREIKNDKANSLGVPLPKGRARFYREDEGRLQFVGENTIDHTPEGEVLRIFTGDAFDIVGERKRTDFKTDSQRFSDESFEIRLRNRKKESVDVRVVEHLYRGQNWEITQKSDAYEKKDSNTIEFKVPVAAGQEKVLTYSIHYTW